MKYHYLFFLIIPICLLIGCNSEKDEVVTQESSDLPFLSFQVDSFEFYPHYNRIPSNIGEFIFSPLGEQDKIWTINIQGLHELDLKTGQWSSLGEKYYTGLKAAVRDQDIWVSPRTQDTYISLSRDGLLHFDRSQDTMIKYDIHPVRAILEGEELLNSWY